jgi:hypothetical protein
MQNKISLCIYFIWALKIMMRTKKYLDLSKAINGEAAVEPVTSPAVSTDSSPKESPQAAVEDSESPASSVPEDALAKAQEYVRRFYSINLEPQPSKRPGGLPRVDEHGRVIRVRNGSHFFRGYGDPMIVVYDKEEPVVVAVAYDNEVSGDEASSELGCCRTM